MKKTKEQRGKATRQGPHDLKVAEPGFESLLSAYTVHALMCSTRQFLRCLVSKWCVRLYAKSMVPICYLHRNAHVCTYTKTGHQLRN